jgi:methyl-accepting chemotaxis protein
MGAQGVEVVNRTKAVSFNGTAFYQWQNPGETSPRDKFAVVKTLPSHPDWVVFVSAYTTDDLLLQFRTVEWWLGGASAVAILLTVLYVFWNTSRMVTAVHTVEHHLTRMAAGDLGAPKPSLAAVAQRKDELGNMARTLATTVEALRNVVSGVQDASAHVATIAESLGQGTDESATAMQQVARAMEEIASGAGELSQGSSAAQTTTSELKVALEQVAQGAQEQTGYVQTTVQIIDKLATDMDQLVTTVRGIQDATEANGASAREGLSLVGTTRGGMELISASVAAATERLGRLSESSRQIGSITDVITEIADQTNLLALNAAIEAARAGEHGRGFAVVAEEVRRLAERSAQSAREISTLVAGIQSSIDSLAGAMEQSNHQVTEGADLVRRSGQAFGDVVRVVEEAVSALQSVAVMVSGNAAATAQALESINSVAAVIEENTAATEEMTASAEQVQQSIEQAAGVASDNAAATEEVSASVEEVTAVVEQIANSARTLRTVAGELQAGVGRFRL